jgi:hypothetical protein
MAERVLRGEHVDKIKKYYIEHEHVMAVLLAILSSTLGLMILIQTKRMKTYMDSLHSVSCNRSITSFKASSPQSVI